MKRDNKQRLFEVVKKLDKTFNDGNPVERLKSNDVAYMELKESNFVCGACIFATESGYCGNKKIMAQISLVRGCCNLYQPKKKDAVDSDEWKINEKNKK